MRTTVLLILTVLIGLSSGVARAEESVLGKLQDEIRGIARRAGPAIVKITAGRPVRLNLAEGGSDSPSRRRILRLASTVGTGFLISEAGHILTTDRLVAGSSGVRVYFPGGPIREATVLGTDSFFKVALLKVEPVEGVVPLEFAEETENPIGSLGVLVGNSFGVSTNLSLSILTGARKSIGMFDAYDNYLVVNTPILPGNTGGPLLDPEGKVIGMGIAAYLGGATHISVAGKGGPVVAGLPGLTGSAGMGLVVPAEDLRHAVDEIESYGRVRSGRLGVTVKPATLEVIEVLPGTPASKAGLQIGDVFASIAGRRIHDDAQFRFALRRLVVGKRLSVGVRRGEDEITVSCTLQDVTEQLRAVLSGLEVAATGHLFVRSVEPRRAEEGLQVGDLILRVDGQFVSGGPSLLRVLGDSDASKPIAITVLRGRKTVKISLER